MNKLFSVLLFLPSFVLIGLAVWSVQGIDGTGDTGSGINAVFTVICAVIGISLFEKARSFWDK